jgi:hypothetical protein
VHKNPARVKMQICIIRLSQLYNAKTQICVTGPHCFNWLVLGQIAEDKKCAVVTVYFISANY